MTDEHISLFLRTDLAPTVSAKTWYASRPRMRRSSAVHVELPRFMLSLYLPNAILDFAETDLYKATRAYFLKKPSYFVQGLQLCRQQGKKEVWQKDATCTRCKEYLVQK